MSDAQRFLALIGGPFIEIRHRLPNGGMANRFFRDADAAATFALDVGGYLDTFAGIAPRVREGGRNADVEQAHIVSADCDDDASLDALASFDPAPSIIIASGSLTAGGRAKVHAHWPLTKGCRPDELEDAKRRLALELGSDGSIRDPARIMRVPGTGNFKTSPARTVKTVRFDDRRHALSEVLRACAQETVATAPQLVGEGAHHDDVLLEIPAAEYVAALTGRVADRHGFVRCPFHAGGDERTPSLRLYGRTWACFACPPRPGAGRGHLGGTAYTFGAVLWDYPLPLRGPAFLAVQDRLLDALLLHYQRTADE